MMNQRMEKEIIGDLIFQRRYEMKADREKKITAPGFIWAEAPEKS
jgi:hypothetical protein